MSPSGHSTDAMDRRRRQHAPGRRAEPAAEPAADVVACADERPADVPAAALEREENASCTNGGQDGSWDNADGLQLVGQELVPASQDLVVKEKKSSGDSENAVGSVTETPQDGRKTYPSSSKSGMQESSGLKELEDMHRPKEFQTPSYPKSQPTSFGPLFSPEQMQQWEKSQAEAPMIQSQRETPTQVFSQGPLPGHQPSMAGVFPWWSAGIAPSPMTPDEASWRFQMQREMESMSMMLRAAHHENVRLRSELMAKEEDGKSAFATPEDLKEDGARAQKDRSEEDGARAQKDRSEEDGARAQKELFKEDGARAQKELGKEDGARAQKDGRRQGNHGSQEEWSDFHGDDQNRSWKGHGRDADDRDTRQSGSTKPQEMEFMMLMLQSMQELQRKISDDREGKDGMEIVRSGAPDLPLLGEWSSTDGPIAMGDWLVLLEPAIADLSESSEEWWGALIHAVQVWYADHMKLSPLERTSHKPVPPQHLQQKRWQRLERRVASMLLKAIPDAQKEELVAGKNLGAFGIMAHLQILYQPGGLGEKETILRNLESPPEASTLQEAVVQLRRWTRWRLRAKDIGVAEPDASVLVRGLSRLVRKILETHAELRFRISLARSTLMLDSAPTASSVERFSTLLLAEIEQVAHTDKSQKKVISQKPKINEMKPRKPDDAEGEKGGGKGKMKSAGDGKTQPCRYFLTDEGCRKGKECTFAHNMDQEKRCWSCGSKSHFAGSCPRVSEAERGQGKGMRSLQKSPEKEGKSLSLGQGTPESSDGSGSSASGVATCGSTSSQEDTTMKQLLEEAHKMLKSMSVKSEERLSDRGEDKISALQRQLEDMRKISIKVFRLTRLQKKGEGWGLLDSGATHPLRPPLKHEDITKLPEVDVTLAGGQEVKMKLSQGGSIVGEIGTEAIVPMGLLTGLLNCRLTWSPKGVKLNHPFKGEIEVNLRDGCPMISSKKALELIEEIESKSAGRIKRMEVDTKEMAWKEAWMDRLVEEHPVFQSLPDRLKAALKVMPSPNVIPLANRRRRKFWKKNGVVIHACSGEKDGYTLSRALKEVGGDPRSLHEFDILHGGAHNDMGLEGQAYGHMLNLAFEGQIKGMVGGPPCRTRSMLRHLEVSGVEGLPRPVRAWNGEEFGIKDATKSEEQQVFEDDVVMFRFWMVWIVAEEVNKMNGGCQQVAFGLEQPAEPVGMPEVVSLWRTPEWKKMAEVYNFEQQTFFQGDYGGEARKPTTWGGNLSIEVPVGRGGGTKRNVSGLSKEQILEGSKKLSRWAPGFMRAVAISVQVRVLRGKVSLRKLSWREHIESGHFPFRRDCMTCQQACAKDAYHRRSRLPPKAGVLSIDVSGPFKEAPDLFRGTMAKYILVATFTWPEPRKKKPEEQFEEEDQACPEEAPQIEDEDLKTEEERELHKGSDGEELPYLTGVDRPELDVDPEPSIAEEVDEDVQNQKDREEEEAQREQPKIKMYRLLTPLPSRNQKEVMRAVVDMYLRLRAEGMIVRQLHSDNAGEFNSMAMAEWCQQRDILHTYTSGDQPQANGRAEQSVAEVKSRIRRMLLAANAGFERWPLAARCLNETLWQQALGKGKKCPPFLAEVLVRKRFWRAKELEPTQEKVLYLGPSWTHHGHWVERPDGSRVLTKMVMSGLEVPPTDAHWIGLEDEEGPIGLRRRLRHKQPIRMAGMALSDTQVDQAWSMAASDREWSAHTVDQERFTRTAGREGPEVLLRDQPSGEVLLRDQLCGEDLLRDQTWEYESEESGQEKQENMLQKVLEEEMTLAVTEQPAALDIVLGCLAQIRQAVVKEEDDVLQTKIVAVSELRKNVQAWTPAIQAELEALFSRKEALKEISEEEGKRLVDEGKAEVIPAKLVCTVKPDPAIKAGKKKVRIVGCGNYAEKDPDTELFAAGTNAVSVRIALAVAAQLGWDGLSMDIRTAFLNAPMDDGGGDQDDPAAEHQRRRSLMKPPGILVALGFVKPGVWWEAVKAVYGYRQSPRLWSDHRDDVLCKMKIQDGAKVIRFNQMLSEPNMWKIVEEEGNEDQENLKGLMLVYVDDLLVLGELSTIFLVSEAINSTWEVSKPELINDQAGTRFLGMELWKRPDGVWMATQTGYTLDLLKRNLGEDQSSWPVRKTPATKDIEEIIEDDKSPHDIRMAQKAVGELVWLVTRCRPDLMYAVARLASGITRMPKNVVLLARQVWMYLAGTINHGLVFKNSKGENSLNVFSDASFGDSCQGCILVQWGHSTLLWKSSRQTLRSSSTAEAELIEFLEAISAGEAIRVVVEEILSRSCFAKAHTDSTAALAIAVGESASWKTRHLRRRASSLRWRITRGDWLARHLAGVDMPADIGTKALCLEKFQRFKILMGMDEVELEKPTLAVQKFGVANDAKLKRVLMSVVLAAQIAVSGAQGGNESQHHGGDFGEQPSLLDFFVFWVVIPAILVISLVLWAQKNSAQKKLLEKEKLEKSQEKEKKMREEIHRQVSEGIRRIQREGSSARSERHSDDESFQASPVRPMLRQRSGETSSCGRSSAARDDGARGSTEGLRGIVGNSRVDSMDKPCLTFPAEAEDLFAAPAGVKYHYDRSCRGLRSASRILLVPRCQNCGPVQVRPKGTLFRTHGGDFHTMRSHAVASGDDISCLEPCLYCTGA